MNIYFVRIIYRHLPAILASVVACIFIYLFTRHSGIGLSPDSVTYYSTAANISQHFSFTDFNGIPLVDFPLGYPVFLVIVSWLSGFSPLQTAPVINAVLISGVLVFTGTIIRGYRKTSLVYRILLLAILCCSPALLEIYSMIWSETLFIFLSLLFLVAARKYFTNHSIGGLLCMGLVAALAFFTRYAGISLVLCGGILLIFDGQLSLRQKIGHLFLFGVTSSTLAAINLIRNHTVSASLAGVREKAVRSAAQNIAQISNTIAEWLPFLKGHERLALLLFVIIFAAAFLLFIFNIVQQQYYHSYETIVACFFITYLIFLVFIASVSRFEDLSSRLLSPIYIPLLLLISSWIVPLYKSLPTIKKRALIVMALLLYAGLLQHQYRLNAEAWEGIKDAGIPGYSEDSWKSSATIQYINQHKKSFSGYLLYSDAYDAVYFLTGLHALPLPHKEIQQEIDDLLTHSSFCVIWLNDGFNADLINIIDIKLTKKITAVTQLADGTIYYFGNHQP